MKQSDCGTKYRNLKIIPPLFEILCSMSMILWPNFKLSSIVTPRYLVIIRWGLRQLFYVEFDGRYWLVNFRRND